MNYEVAAIDLQDLLACVTLALLDLVVDREYGDFFNGLLADIRRRASSACNIRWTLARSLVKELESMKRLLIVDDAPFLRSVVREVAVEAGWDDVVEATDAESAVTVFESQRPNLVVLDLRLPKGCGLDVVTSMRSLDAHACIIALGSLNQKEESKEAIRRGAAAVVTKPFAREHLLAVVRHFG